MAQSTKQIPIATRQEVFRALVEVQDGGLDAVPSRRLIATKFAIEENDVRRIEEESLANEWPPL